MTTYVPQVTNYTQTYYTPQQVACIDQIARELGRASRTLHINYVKRLGTRRLRVIK